MNSPGSGGSGVNVISECLQLHTSNLLLSGLSDSGLMDIVRGASKRPSLATTQFGGPSTEMNYHNAVVANPTTHNRQAFLIFAISVAGKRADSTVKKVEEFFIGLRPNELPFDFIRKLSAADLQWRLKQIRIGRYAMLTQAYRQVALKINVDKTSVAELEAIDGIGPKTSRYFMVYAHGQNDLAVIDTHVRKFLADCGARGVTYEVLEKEFLKRCKALGYSAKEVDNWIWRHFARREEVGYKEMIAELRKLGLAR